MTSSSSRQDIAKYFVSCLKFYYFTLFWQISKFFYHNSIMFMTWRSQLCTKMHFILIFQSSQRKNIYNSVKTVDRNQRCSIGDTRTRDFHWVLLVIKHVHWLGVKPEHTYLGGCELWFKCTIIWCYLTRVLSHSPCVSFVSALGSNQHLSDLLVPPLCWTVG